MAQPPLTRPFGEGDLPHQFGPGPVGRPLLDRIEEGGVRDFPGSELVVKLPQKLIAEARADLSGVAEPTVVVVVPDEKSPQADARPGWLGPPADHQLLAGRALEF